MSDSPGRGRLDGDRLETWAALATVLEWLPTALDAQLQREGLTHFEYGVLFALSDADGHTLRMSTLAGYSNSSLSRLSRAVARLEAKHWVRRSPDPEDGRYTLAVLTEAGREKVTQAAPGHEELIQRMVFDSLTAAQARQLREISRRIMKAIRAEEGWRPGEPARPRETPC
jgi:DNA-binding MarR family transcriptional regulator